KQPAEAVRLIQLACQRQPDQFQRRNYLHFFLRDMADAGHGLDAYLAAPDASAALQTLGGYLVQHKRAKELAELGREPGKKHAEDKWLLFYQGELHLLSGETAEAEACFAAALDRGGTRDPWLFRNGLLRARVRAGKAAAAYRELGGGTLAFN